jgi:hypothetical protein
MWRQGILIITLGAMGLGPFTVEGQEAPQTFRGSIRLLSKRVELGAHEMVRLRLEGMAHNDLVVLRSHGREMRIVGGVYLGTPLRGGRGEAHLLPALVQSLPARYAPLPDETLQVTGAEVVFQRPAALSGVVFLDISVPEGVRVYLEMNGRLVLDAKVSIPLAFSEGRVQPGPRRAAETMMRVAFPETPDVVPLAAPGEYAVAFHRLKVRHRVMPKVAAGKTAWAILLINEEGRVVRALAFVDGQRQGQLEEQLRQWAFEPFWVNGEAVRVVTMLTLH